MWTGVYQRAALQFTEFSAAVEFSCCRVSDSAGEMDCHCNLNSRSAVTMDSQAFTGRAPWQSRGAAGVDARLRSYRSIRRSSGARHRSDWTGRAFSAVSRVADRCSSWGGADTPGWSGARGVWRGEYWTWCRVRPRGKVVLRPRYEAALSRRQVDWRTTPTSVPADRSGRRPVQPVPLFTKAKGIQALRPINREHAIDMVDLVLEQLGAITLDVHLGPFPFQVLIPDPNRYALDTRTRRLGKEKQSSQTSKSSFPMSMISGLIRVQG